MSRRLSGFLADNSMDQLQRMLRDMRQTRERTEEDIQQMQLEERVVEEAIARKSKRRSPARKASVRSAATSGKRITRQQVLEFVNRTFDGFFNSTFVVDALAEEGIKTNGEAVRQHLRRLADEGDILREGKGFAPTAAARIRSTYPDQASPNGDGQRGGDGERGGEVASRSGSG